MDVNKKLIFKKSYSKIYFILLDAYKNNLEVSIKNFWVFSVKKLENDT